MTFTWNSSNEVSHYHKHKIHFSTAAFFMEHGDIMVLPDPEHSIDEIRQNCVAAYNDHYLWMSFTEPESDLIRIISARLATRNEIELYYSGTEG